MSVEARASDGASAGVGLARSAVLVKIFGLIVLFLVAAALAAATLAYAAPLRGISGPS